MRQLHEEARIKQVRVMAPGLRCQGQRPKMGVQSEEAMNLKSMWVVGGRGRGTLGAPSMDKEVLT